MKKLLLIVLLIGSTAFLASCGSEGPLTESEQAEKFNMSGDKFQETKEAAARMNMTVEDHMKMTDTEMGEMDSESMDMSDDSDMIEDDSEIMHKMDDGAMMDENTMHMETLHEGEEIETHGSDKHGEH